MDPTTPDRFPSEPPRASIGSSVPESCARPDLARLLISHDDLPVLRRREVEAHARACPSCGLQLELLRQAAIWLERQGPANHFPARAGETCPAAEDLYDFGRGPGAQPLDSNRHRMIQAHLVACAECTSLVATLSARPPVPLEVLHIKPSLVAAHVPTPHLAPRTLALVPPIEESGLEDEDDQQEELQPVQRGPRRLWIPLAAAAAVLIGLGLWWQETQATGRRTSTELVASAIRFPAQPVLRGDAAGSLWFPRDRVLMRVDANGERHPWFSPRFEIAPLEGASSYRAALQRNEGGAFDRGSTVATLRSDSPMLELDANALAALAPGRYTWEAWAQIGGLDTFLGRRDFEAIEDAEVTRAMADLEHVAEPERATRTLALLHEHGFLTDARAFARSLPATPERDRYLSDVPGR